LFGPEFQITQETSAVGMSNHVHSIVHNGIGTGERNAADESVSVRLELTPYIALLERTENTATVNQSDLIDSFNALLLGGRMSSGLAQSIRNAWASLPGNFGDNSDRQRDRVRLALYIIAASPEFSVQR
jgi:hypothetical protein